MERRRSRASGSWAQIWQRIGGARYARLVNTLFPSRIRDFLSCASGPQCVASILVALCLGCGAPPVDESATPVGASRQLDAIATLEQSRDAITSATTYRHSFTFGERDSPVGYATGTTLVLRRTNLGDSLIRVRGTAQLSPDGLDEEFVYSTDGKTVWSRTESDDHVQTSPAAGGRSLGTLGVYGYLPELLEAEPFWKELDSAESLRMLEQREVGGVVCDVVEAVWNDPVAGGGVETTRYLWFIGAEDQLPRGMHWTNSTTGPGGASFLLSDLEAAVELSDADFVLSEDEVPGAQSAGVAVGDISPDWTLQTSGGETVTLSSLRGRVVVLDFWNTWCFICRNLQPQMKQLAADFADQPVTVLGLNVFETGDATAYWQARSPGYEFLVDADSVAELYDVPWQPAVVVIGPEGRVLLNMLGGDGDRGERVRAAVEAGLAGT